MAKNPTQSIMVWGIGIGSLALFGLVMLVLFGNLQSSDLGFVDLTSGTVTVTNETNSWINLSGYTLSGKNSSWNKANLTTIWSNQPNSANLYNYTINVANATISSINNITNTSNFNGSAFSVLNNVSLSYTYTISYNSQAENDANSFIGNYTTSVRKTGEQFPTVGTILGVALLLVILVGLLTYAVKKMSGVSGGMGSGRGENGGMPEGDFG